MLPSLCKQLFCFPSLGIQILLCFLNTVLIELLKNHFQQSSNIILLWALSETHAFYINRSASEFEHCIGQGGGSEHLSLLAPSHVFLQSYRNVNNLGSNSKELMNMCKSTKVSSIKIELFNHAQLCRELIYSGRLSRHRSIFIPSLSLRLSSTCPYHISNNFVWKK